MIPNRSADVEVTNNIDSDATGQFTVDEDSLGKIMSVLTNLYSDPEGAVIREYLTNGYDAQVDAGMVLGKNWRPIEVTTPSHFVKEYKVRDFGIGLSVDDIKTVYSKYGKSTKESSNDVTGMLGLGSKCALTYTGQFTITGFKNGVRTRAVVTKDDNDIPVFMIVDTRATTEPNGVEIAVPVRDRNTFETKVGEFLKFWPAGSVLVNGSAPVAHNLTLVKNDAITFNIAGQDVSVNVPVYVDGNNQTGWIKAMPKSYVVMGNVPYEVDSQYVPGDLTNSGVGFVAYVPMGAVDFPPSREKLFYNTRTKAAVAKIGQGLFDHIVAEALKKVVSEPDHRSAWKAHNSLPHHIARTPKASGLTYKGERFIERLAHVHSELTWDWQGHGQVSARTWVSLPTVMQGSLIVTGVPDGTKPTSYFKKKVRHYMKDNSIDADFAILTDKDITNVWLDWVPRVDADTIKALKLPKTTTQTGPRVEAPYDYFVLGPRDCIVKSDSQVLVPCPAGKTLAYISPQDMKETYRKRGTNASTLLKSLGEDVILVVLGKNRFEKFLRTHPNAVKASVAAQAKVNALVAATTDAEMVLGELPYSEVDFLKKVDPDNLDDPDLADLARLVQSGKTGSHYQKAKALVNLGAAAEMNLNLPEKKAKASASSRYALINHIGGRQIRHMVMYCNAVYASDYAPKP